MLLFISHVNDAEKTMSSDCSLAHNLREPFAVYTLSDADPAQSMARERYASDLVLQNGFASVTEVQ